MHIEKKKKHTCVNFFKTRLILSAHVDILPVDIHACLLAECSMQGLERYLGDLIQLSILLLFSFVLHNMCGTPQIKLLNEKFVTTHSDTTQVMGAQNFWNLNQKLLCDNCSRCKANEEKFVRMPVRR